MREFLWHSPRTAHQNVVSKHAKVEMEKSSKVYSNKEGAPVKNAVVEAKPSPVFMTLHEVFIPVKSTQSSWKPNQVQLIFLGAVQTHCPSQYLHMSSLCAVQLHLSGSFAGVPAFCCAMERTARRTPPRRCPTHSGCLEFPMQRRRTEVYLSICKSSLMPHVTPRLTTHTEALQC